MRFLLTLAVAALAQCAFAADAFAQTASELEVEYGKPVVAYPVSPHVWMTPEFDKDGQMCAARLYRRRISSRMNLLGNEMPAHELKDVLNRLAPPRVRGEKRAMFGISLLGGGAAKTTFPFETVTITFMTPVSFGPSEDGKEPPKETPAAKEGAQDKAKSDDIFDNPFVGGAQIVVVSWNGRKCREE